jgi:hypothetical protein
MGARNCFITACLSPQWSKQQFELQTLKNAFKNKILKQLWNVSTVKPLSYNKCHKNTGERERKRERESRMKSLHCTHLDNRFSQQLVHFWHQRVFNKCIFCLYKAGWGVHMCGEVCWCVWSCAGVCVEVGRGCVGVCGGVHKCGRCMEVCGDV